MSTITPELALIDPELAAAARALLPEPGAFRPAWRTQPTILARLSTPAPPAAGARASRRHARRSRRVVLVVCTLAIVAAVGGTSGSTLVGRSEATQTAVARAVRQTDVARGAKAARTYTWPTIPGARTYEIRLVRGRTAVWSTTTTVPAAELPARLHLPPGRYTWSATPGFGKPLLDAAARPVVEMTFQVA